ncbi:hypothetical protein MD484_g6177, partial [Candolleomyces efflorescens]
MFQENRHSFQQQQQAQVPPPSGRVPMSGTPRPPFGLRNDQKATYSNFQDGNLGKQEPSPPPPLPPHPPQQQLLRHQTGSENMPPSFVGHRDHESVPPPRVPPLNSQGLQQTHGQLPAHHPPSWNRANPYPPGPPRPQPPQAAVGGYAHSGSDGWWHQGGPQPFVGHPGPHYHYQPQPQQPRQLSANVPEFVPTQRYQLEATGTVHHRPHYHYASQWQQPQPPQALVRYGVDGTITVGYQPDGFRSPQLDSVRVVPPPPPPPGGIPSRFQHQQHVPTTTMMDHRTGYPITRNVAQRVAKPQTQHSEYQVPTGLGQTRQLGGPSGEYGSAGGGGGGGVGAVGGRGGCEPYDAPYSRRPSPTPLSAVQVSGPLKRPSVNPLEPPSRPVVDQVSSVPVYRFGEVERTVPVGDQVQRGYGEQGLDWRVRQQDNRSTRQQHQKQTTQGTATRALWGTKNGNTGRTGPTGIEPTGTRHRYAFGTIAIPDTPTAVRTPTRTPSPSASSIRTPPSNRSQQKQKTPQQQQQRIFSKSSFPGVRQMGSLKGYQDMVAVSPPRPGLSPIGSRRARMRGAAQRAKEDEAGEPKSSKGVSGSGWRQDFSLSSAEPTRNGGKDGKGTGVFGSPVVQLETSPSAPAATIEDEELTPVGRGEEASRPAARQSMLLTAWTAMRRHSSPDTRPMWPSVHALLELLKEGKTSSRVESVEENGSVGSSDSETVVGPASGMINGEEDNVHGRDTDGKKKLVEAHGRSVMSNEAVVRAPSYAEIAARRAGARLRGKKSVPR